MRFSEYVVENYQSATRNIENSPTLNDFIVIFKNPYFRKLFTDYFVILTEFPYQLKVFKRLKKITVFIFVFFRICCGKLTSGGRNVQNIPTINDLWSRLAVTYSEKCKYKNGYFL